MGLAEKYATEFTNYLFGKGPYRGKKPGCLVVIILFIVFVALGISTLAIAK